MEDKIVYVPVTDEEIEKLAEKEYPVQMRGCANDGLPMIDANSNDRDNFIKGFKSALQYAKQSPWIKASERLPNDGVDVYVKNIKTGFKRVLSHQNNGWYNEDEECYNYRDEENENIIWLDESAPQYSVSDGFENKGG